MKWLLDKYEVAGIIEHKLGDLIPDPALQTIVSDKEYRSVSLKWVTGRISTDEILTGAYTENVFDCEDMAFYLRTKASLFSLHSGRDAPMAMGILLTHIHAFNFCVDDSRSLTLIDTANFARKGYCRKQEDFEKFLEIDEAGNLIRLAFI
ncbi:hypothetical protein EPICR_80021 [Candidatus Desulfarcum epimagneticum]|uniref:Uncharacterized protein n=1 Tax=uncultured Desulfobacteraceae bacterium TaxID=218296 RepID=A0A484HM79_9BACT|nr:hypothetical protein EPICR_80021 [uncultured Desulfobacteraceae bacterium]